MVAYPNSVGDVSASAALTRFDALPVSVTTCHDAAELFYCAKIFPDCPLKGWTRQPCKQLCQTVQTACQAAYNAAFPSAQWPWDCSDLHDTGEADELCLHPEGGRSCSFLLS